MVNHLDPGPLMSQATVWNGVAYLSGQVALDQRESDLATQARTVFRQIDTVLDQVGSHRDKLLTATIWLTDAADFSEFNTLWRAWLGEAAPPARATVCTELVLPGLLIEVQVTAAVA